MRHNQKGFTLLELTLVLTLASAIMVMGLRLYQSYQRDQDFEKLKYNVNVLLVGMSRYYYYACSNVGTTSPSPPLPPVTVAVLQKGYLMSPWQPNNNLVDNSDPAMAYVVAFNPTQSLFRYAYACWNFTGKGTDTTCQEPQAINRSYVYTWQVQVSVKLANPANAAAFRDRLGADCISNARGTMVDACSARSPTSGSYLVWQRMPSWVTFNTGSTYWMSTPILNAFKNQYDHDPMYDLSNPSDPATYPSIVNKNSKNYFCGG